MARLFSFPNPVNETSARIVAGGALAQALVVIVVGYYGEELGIPATVSDLAWWVLVPLAYGFLARVLTGPTLSPLGLLTTRVISPAISKRPKLVPGPPKRFAQGIGTVFSGSALVLALVLHQHGAAAIILGLLSVAATLEAVFGFCLGCSLFQGLMKVGVIPEAVCIECNNIWARTRIPAGNA